MTESITLKSLQDFIKSKDFNLENKHGYFLKLVEEVGELSEVLRKNRVYMPHHQSIKGSINEELYDVLYYVAALANVYEIDLEECCRLKEAINAKRIDR